MVWIVTIPRYGIKREKVWRLGYHPGQTTLAKVYQEFSLKIGAVLTLPVQYPGCTIHPNDV
jgi:hypothetical protein